MDDKAPKGTKSSIRANVIVTNALTIAYFVFALFPVFWILLLSLKPDEQLFTTYFVFDPTLENYKTVLGLSGGTSGIPFARFFVNSLVISFGAVAIALVVGVPAAYAAARWKFRGSESLLFTLLSFRFAPELTVIIPL
jgi:multiple sugar transport system permease protein